MKYQLTITLDTIDPRTGHGVEVAEDDLVAAAERAIDRVEVGNFGALCFQPEAEVKALATADADPSDPNGDGHGVY